MMRVLVVEDEELLAAAEQDGHDDHVDRRQARRQHQALVIAVRHDEAADQPRGDEGAVARRGERIRAHRGVHECFHVSAKRSLNGADTQLDRGALRSGAVPSPAAGNLTPHA